MHILGALAFSGDAVFKTSAQFLLLKDNRATALTNSSNFWLRDDDDLNGPDGHAFSKLTSDYFAVEDISIPGGML